MAAFAAWLHGHGVERAVLADARDMADELEAAWEHDA